MVRFVIFVMIIVFAQCIEMYSHTWFPDPQRGANLEARWSRYKSISYKTKAAVDQVCGSLDGGKCLKPAGRPSDEETASCDKYCCHDGYLTGFCYGSVTVGVKGSSRSDGSMEYKPSVGAFADCKCTNDIKDASCGPDGSFLGIRCPFDRSACARKCCRQGKSGGRCGGFLRTKCKCD